jgi:PAS domain S-box-containing protein
MSRPQSGFNWEDFDMLPAHTPLLIQLAQHSRDLVGVVDQDLRLVFLNGAGRDMLGLVAGDPLDLTLNSIVASHLNTKLNDEIFPQAKSGEVWDGVLQLRGQPGDLLIETYCFISAIRNGDGDANSYAIIAHAVSAEATALERLERKAASFNALIQNCPFGVFVVDSDLRVLVASNGASSAFEGFDITTHPKHEDCVRAIWPPAFADEIMSHFSQTLKTGESYLAPSTIEERFDTHVKEAYDWRLDRIVLPDGSFGVVCYFYDFTERQLWADELQEAKGREEANALELEGLYEEAPLGLAMVDRDFRFVRMNPACVAMIAATRSDALGKTPWQISPILEQTLKPIFLNVLEKGESVRNFTITGARRADQTVAPEWLTHFYPVKDPKGEISGIGIMVQDITLQRQSEEALRASEQKLRLVLDQLFAFVGILTPDGFVTYANKTPLEAADIQLRDVVGNHFSDAHWWSYSLEIQKQLREAITSAASGKIVRYDVPVLLVDQLVTIDFQIAPLRGEDDQIIGLIPSGVVVEDRIQAQRELLALTNDLEAQVERRTQALITANAELLVEKDQREAVQSALLQSQKLEAVGRLVSGVAHDFNNILAAVISGLSLIQRRVDDAQVTNIIQMSTSAARRGAGLIKHMLAFARQQPLSPQFTQLSKVFEEIVPLMNLSLGGFIKLDVEHDIDLWPIIVDGDQLCSAVLNLTINARDAMPNGGTLTLCGANVDRFSQDRPHDLPDGEFVAISVTDTGTGMSAETLAKFAEPFFTTKELGKGTGLGVAMVE